MTYRAIHMEVRPRASFKIQVLIVRISESRQLSNWFRQRVGDQSNMLQCPQLVGLNTPVIVRFIQLHIAETKHKIRGSAVARTAFSPAWITPDLLSSSPGRAPILNGCLLYT